VEQSGEFISEGTAGQTEEAVKALESDCFGGDHHRHEVPQLREVPQVEFPQLPEELLHLCHGLFQRDSVDGGDLYLVNRS
jgi:hypothetical protein